VTAAGGWINKLYYGDCLSVMRDMPKDYVDLVYLDPPFNSNREYAAIYEDDTGRIRRPLGALRGAAARYSNDACSNAQHRYFGRSRAALGPLDAGVEES
jgi:DNA modification methylase